MLPDINFHFNELELDQDGRQAVMMLPTVKNNPKALAAVQNDPSFPSPFVDEFIVRGMRELQSQQDIERFRALAASSAELQRLALQYTVLLPQK